MAQTSMGLLSFDVWQLTQNHNAPYVWMKTLSDSQTKTIMIPLRSKRVKPEETMVLDEAQADPVHAYSNGKGINGHLQSLAPLPGTV